MGVLVPSVRTIRPGWYPYRGGWVGSGNPTRAGVRVDPDTARSLSPVFAARRVLSETIAALPISLVQILDERRRQPASGHRMSRLLGFEPCPAMDSMTWFDMQIGWQTDLGNAFAEKQRDLAEQVVALWPIHPSRVPPQNVVVAEDGRFSEYGIRNGETVYLVANDDGTFSPVPARDMLHVVGAMPGVRQTPAGVPYGLGVIEAGAESIGTAVAVERSCSAFFRNGMSSRVALTHPKMVSKEAANRLREQWQERYGGADNAYKALILEEGMEPKVLTVNPEAAQLLATREFTVREVARWYRLPPHLLGDLARATWSNIDAEQLNFVVHSLLPWLVRWERALRRQLLTPDEWASFQFKFNVNGLLRGDYAARSAFYKEMFNIGVFSQNEIRALEDLNAIEDGDRHFIPTNNLTPSDRVDDMIDARMKTGGKASTEPGEEPKPNASMRRLKASMALMIEKAEAGLSADQALAACFEGQSTALASLGERVGSMHDMIASLLNEDGERAISLHAASVDAEERFGTLAGTAAVAVGQIKGAAEEIEAKAADLSARLTAHEAREQEFAARQRSAARATLRGVLVGVVALESRAVKQAAKDFRSFGEVTDKFYTAKLPEVWSAAVGPLLPMCEAAGVPLDSAAELASHVAASRESLAGWDGVPNQQVAAWVAERVDAWSARPAAAAARLVPEGAA